MGAQHTYAIGVEWTGAGRDGTAGYRTYGRDHIVTTAGKPAILGSADATFRGDRDRWNPEELLVSSLAQCHMLAYLHLAVRAGIVVVAYRDDARGTMVQDDQGDGGSFAEVTLRPTVTITDAERVTEAQELHHAVPAVCFIARSVNFPVLHEPTIIVAAADA
jgi:organic hydroperoxide reductase OsmC/OhrA